MAQNVDVSARLTLFTGDASRRLARLSANLRQVSEGAKTADSYMVRFAKRAALMGAAYVGIHAMTNSFKNLVHSSFEFEKQMQQTRIGLQTMVSNIEGVSFGQAAGQVEGIWDRLTNISVRTVATTKEIHEVFAGIYGPLRNAGASMETLYKNTQNTVHAASALGVDVPQATRDIMLMATGRAQAQVKLFTRLRSSGFLKDAKGAAMTAEKWNKLAASDRLEKLTGALAKFEDAGAAAEKSLPGRVSTFTDMVEQMRRAFFSPIFTKLADKLGKLNVWLLANKSYMDSMLTMWGTRVAEALESFIEKFEPGIKTIGSDLGAAGEKLGVYIDKMKVFVGYAVDVAKVLAAVSVAKSAGGMAAGAASSMLHVGAIVAEGGLAGLGTAISSALGVALLPLTAALAVLGSIGYYASENMYWVNAIWDSMLPNLISIGNAFSQLGRALWRVAKPLLGLIGATGFWALAGLLRGMAWLIDTLLVPVIEDLTNDLNMLAGALTWIGEKFMSVIGVIKEEMYTLGLLARPALKNDILHGAFENSMTSRGFGGMVTAPGVGTMPAETRNLAKPTNVYDFKGSKITLKQEFRQADPDRVAIQMIKDLARFSEQRVTSGFVPATTG